MFKRSYTVPALDRSAIETGISYIIKVIKLTELDKPKQILTGTE